MVDSFLMYALTSSTNLNFEAELEILKNNRKDSTFLYALNSIVFSSTK